MKRQQDEKLRDIARRAVPSGVYSGNVKALRAVAAAAFREGAQYAAVECGAIPNERVAWFVESENPYI